MEKITVIFMTIHFISCFLYFFVDNVYFLIFVRFVHGIGFGASANAIVTIASAILPKNRFAEAFGYFMLGITIAVGLGPFIWEFFMIISNRIDAFWWQLFLVESH